MTPFYILALIALPAGLGKILKVKVFGLSVDFWSLVFSIVVIIFLLLWALIWKCPNCKSFPGGGWFRKNCKNCNAKLR